MMRTKRALGLNATLAALGIGVCALLTAPKSARACNTCSGSGIVRAVADSTTAPSSNNNSGFQISSSGVGTWSLAGVGAPASNTFVLYNDVAGANVFTVNPATAGGFVANTTTFYGDIRPPTAGTRNIGNSVNWFLQVVATNFLTMSDRRLKTDIAPLAKGIDTVMKLRPVSFKWKADQAAPTSFGLIAQDVREVLPNLVTTDASTPDSKLGVRYSELIPVLIRSVQEQQALIDKQAARIAHLEQSSPLSLGTLGGGGLLAVAPLGIMFALRRRKEAPAS